MWGVVCVPPPLARSLGWGSRMLEGALRSSEVHQARGIEVSRRESDPVTWPLPLRLSSPADASTSDYQTIYGSPPLSSIRLPPSTGRPVSISFEQRLTHLSSPTPDLGLSSHHSSASDSSPIPQLSPMGSMSPGSEVGRELGSLEEALEGITLEQREARGRRRREEERQMMRNIDEVQWAKVPPTDQVPRPTFSPALSDTMSFPSTPPPDLYTPPPHFSSFFNVRTPPPRPARPLTAPPTPATSLTTNDNRLQRTLSTSSQVSLTLTGSRSPGMTDSGRRDSNGKDSKRSSVLLGFVGLAGLGRKNSSRGSLSSSNRSSVLLDTTAPSSSSMTRGPSSNSIASSQSIDEEEEGVVVRTRTSKAAAVLGITDGVLPTNVRRPSSTISKAASSSSSASGEAGKRRGSMGVGGDIGEVLPWFPCARKELVENQLCVHSLPPPSPQIDRPPSPDLPTRSASTLLTRARLSDNETGAPGTSPSPPSSSNPSSTPTLSSRLSTPSSPLPPWKKRRIDCS